jgi:hypothetical protein
LVNAVAKAVADRNAADGNMNQINSITQSLQRLFYSLTRLKPQIGNHLWGNEQTLKTLVAVIGTHGCVGHLLNTAKGWKAYDANDKALGTFPDQTAAVQVVLTLGRP